jgi:hypothetical protein
MNIKISTRMQIHFTCSWMFSFILIAPLQNLIFILGVFRRVGAHSIHTCLRTVTKWFSISSNTVTDPEIWSYYIRDKLVKKIEKIYFLCSRDIIPFCSSHLHQDTSIRSFVMPLNKVTYKTTRSEGKTLFHFCQVTPYSSFHQPIALKILYLSRH